MTGDTLQATSVAVERLFSNAALIDQPKRRLLKDLKFYFKILIKNFFLVTTSFKSKEFSAENEARRMFFQLARDRGEARCNSSSFSFSLNFVEPRLASFS